MDYFTTNLKVFSIIFVNYLNGFHVLTVVETVVGIVKGSEGEKHLRLYIISYWLESLEKRKFISINL